jgi:hypothetical protein
VVKIAREIIDETGAGSPPMVDVVVMDEPADEFELPLEGLRDVRSVIVAPVFDEQGRFLHNRVCVRMPRSACPEGEPEIVRYLR